MPFEASTCVTAAPAAAAARVAPPVYAKRFNTFTSRPLDVYKRQLHNIDRIGNSCVNLVEVANDNVTMQSFFIDDDDNGEVRIA